MNPNLEQAIIQFLADQFQLSPENIIPDTDFRQDFNLDEDQLTDLIGRMQDALEFTLPEDKIAEIHTVGDLFNSLHPEDANPNI
jgi:acyl carrier protein